MCLKHYAYRHIKQMWRNWYTRMIQVHVHASGFGFESRHLQDIDYFCGLENNNTCSKCLHVRAGVIILKGPAKQEFKVHEISQSAKQTVSAKHEAYECNFNPAKEIGKKLIHCISKGACHGRRKEEYPYLRRT